MKSILLTLLSLSAAFFMTLALSSCGDDLLDADANDANDANVVPEKSDMLAGTSKQHWTSGCTNTQSITTAMFDIKAGKFEYKMTKYAEEACKTQTWFYTMNGDYTIGAAVTTPASSFALDLKASISSVMALTADEAKVWNEGDGVACSLTNLEANAGKALVLAPETCPYPKLGNMLYMVFKVKEKKLQLGEVGKAGTNNGSTAEKRITSLSSVELTVDPNAKLIAE